MEISGNKSPSDINPIEGSSDNTPNTQELINMLDQINTFCKGQLHQVSKAIASGNPNEEKSILNEFTASINPISGELGQLLHNLSNILYKDPQAKTNTMITGLLDFVDFIQDISTSGFPSSDSTTYKLTVVQNSLSAATSILPLFASQLKNNYPQPTSDHSIEISIYKIYEDLQLPLQALMNNSEFPSASTSTVTTVISHLENYCNTLENIEADNPTAFSSNPTLENLMHTAVNSLTSAIQQLQKSPPNVLTACNDIKIAQESTSLLVIFFSPPPN